MKITGVELENIRGFKKSPMISLSPGINIFVGANNSGKSTLLNSILFLQISTSLKQSDITIGQKEGQIKLLRPIEKTALKSYLLPT